MAVNGPTAHPGHPGHPVRTVAVLGSTGFLGAQVCTTLEAAGLTVHRITRDRLDLAEATPERLAEVLARCAPEVVVNAAGAVWGVTDQQMGLLNEEVPRALAGAAGLLPRPFRIVHPGSVHEYGPTPPGGPVTEDRRPEPVGVYGRTKARGSRAVVAAGGVVLRLSNVIGPGAPADSLPGVVARQLALAAAEAAAGRPVPELRLAPLVSYRDFVDVRDAADAVSAAALATCTGRVFNIAAGEPVPVRLLVRRMVELSGLPVRIVEEGVAGNPRGGADRQLLDISAAGRDLGWRPRRSLDRSLRDLLAPIGLPGAFEPTGARSRDSGPRPECRTEQRGSEDDRSEGSSARRGAEVPRGAAEQSPVRARRHRDLAVGGGAGGR